MAEDIIERVNDLISTGKITYKLPTPVWDTRMDGVEPINGGKAGESSIF